MKRDKAAEFTKRAANAIEHLPETACIKQVLIHYDGPVVQLSRESGEWCFAGRKATREAYTADLYHICVTMRNCTFRWEIPRISIDELVTDYTVPSPLAADAACDVEVG